MKNIAVVFHSLCGNTMRMAKYYEQSFLDEGFAVSLFRVRDNSYLDTVTKYKPALELQDEMMAISVIDDAGLLAGYDAIVMGSPVYYGNVSSQMKAFMDKFGDYHKEMPFSGKYFMSFASCENYAGGGFMCLQALNTFAMHQGMFIVPLPPDTQFMPPYGCIHYSGPNADSRPDHSILMGIRRHVYRVAAALSEFEEMAEIINRMGGDVP